MKTGKLDFGRKKESASSNAFLCSTHVFILTRRQCPDMHLVAAYVQEHGAFNTRERRGTSASQGAREQSVCQAVASFKQEDPEMLHGQRSDSLVKRALTAGISKPFRRWVVIEGCFTSTSDSGCRRVSQHQA